MLMIEKVTGNGEQAKPLVVGASTVYVHENIVPVAGQEDVFTYKETQYSKDEYIALLSKSNDGLAAAVNCLLRELAGAE